MFAKSNLLVFDSSKVKETILENIQVMVEFGIFYNRILISEDPIAIDQACIDLVYASDDPGKDHLIERIESRNGVHTIEAAAALGYGSRDYELIELD